MKRIAFVGGFTDARWFNRQVVSVCRRWQQQHPQCPSCYFEWTQQRRLAHWVAEHKGAVTVIGHSYGAATAARVVAAGHGVDLLITVDPVSWRRPPMHNIARHARCWYNYRATGYHHSFRSWYNNALARLGGAWGELPAPYATRHHVSQHHDHMTVFDAFGWPVSGGEPQGSEPE